MTERKLEELAVKLMEEEAAGRGEILDAQFKEKRLLDVFYSIRPGREMPDYRTEDKEAFLTAAAERFPEIQIAEEAEQQLLKERMDRPAYAGEHPGTILYAADDLYMITAEVTKGSGAMDVLSAPRPMDENLVIRDILAHWYEIVEDTSRYRVNTVVSIQPVYHTRPDEKLALPVLFAVLSAIKKKPLKKGIAIAAAGEKDIVTAEAVYAAAAVGCKEIYCIGAPDDAALSAAAEKKLSIVREKDTERLFRKAFG